MGWRLWWRPRRLSQRLVTWQVHKIDWGRLGDASDGLSWGGAAQGSSKPPPGDQGVMVVGEGPQAMGRPSRSIGPSIRESRGTCMAHAEVSPAAAWGLGWVVKPDGEGNGEPMVEGSPC